ncbi:CoA transferase [Verminephrobacter aporrectodeae]|nr:CoA transferase [Verminephrobacter aporrectodeae]MCW5255220.1 CoA transferase [Verminephrobacter aporrectodeae subsp. tuberculatae]MCW8164081.1 CoA transferase [Verminephrobacter aporrectodeae subsp. tuberculatae]MCW8168226.1 CoA transferase [Verminephrobacter aporrectodeae subsp. tuberculatae]MCW8174823.1 CoA transferase [Verminephrobacter aporrectodeae subsp. tuberculatae]MCW8202435.1 CoA transferase [Verminephrobacter aporrectodeae subsp. tuberculatae]
MPPALPQPLRNTRILSLALNLPGPAALMRCARMGAECSKLESPPAPGQCSADPMASHDPAVHATLHAGVRLLYADLKTPAGQASLHAELARSDALLTSFRPSALARLGLDQDTLQARYPRLSLIRIVGTAGERAEEPGHDLTYLAKAGLVTGDEMPPTLYADMGGALMASEAVLQALLERAHTGAGACIEVALADAAAWLALPRDWGLTTPEGPVGGGHAGYRVYPCADGRVAVAALEPHFAARLCAAAGLPATGDALRLHAPATHQAIAGFLRTQTRAQLDALAQAQDIPLHTLA